jgi:hypothetical protein
MHEKTKAPRGALVVIARRVQRLAMYIVTSKPKRISVYSGLVHMWNPPAVALLRERRRAAYREMRNPA